LFTLFLLFGFAIQNINSQNFQMLKSNSEYIYMGSSEKLRSIRVDSVAFDGDSIFYMNNHIRPIENENFECFTLRGASMIGKKLHIKSDGTHVLFNAINDSIIIKTQNNIGEPWICWKHPENGTQIVAEVQLQDE